MPLASVNASVAAWQRGARQGPPGLLRMLSGHFWVREMNENVSTAEDTVALCVGYIVEETQYKI